MMMRAFSLAPVTCTRADYSTHNGHIIYIRLGKKVVRSKFKVSEKNRRKDSSSFLITLLSTTKCATTRKKAFSGVSLHKQIEQINMSSWYSAFESATEALNKIGDTIADELPSFEAASEALNKIPTLDTASEALSGISTKALNNEFVSKLTLRSDELVREHELLDAQEKRKELVREYLSEILPWETKDESKEILVEQCKEAILNLSRDKASFETPFALENGQMFNPDNYTEVTFENSSDEADAEEGNDNEHNKDVGDSTIEMTPEQKLEKMLPLPLLLEHFDIDTHVGLIERLLKVDEDLVYMHSMLSGMLGGLWKRLLNILHLHLLTYFLLNPFLFLMKFC